MLLAYSSAQQLPRRLPADCVSSINASIGGNWQPVVGKDGWIFRYPGDFTDKAIRPAENSLFQQVINALRTKDIAITMMLLPPRGAVDRSLIGRDPLIDGFNINKAKRRYTQALDELNGMGITAPNLLSVAEAITAQGNPFYLSQDNHWSPEGAMASAEALLESAPHLKGNIAMELKVQESATYVGNLARVLSGACPEYKSIEQEVNIGTVSTAVSGLGLFDDSPEASAVLVGTSQSYNPKWGFGSFLEYTLEKPIINAAVAAGGPWRSLVTYVSSPDFQERQIDHIIWEIPYPRLSEMLRDKPENEIYLRQLLGVLEGTCLEHTDPVVFEDITELSLSPTLFGINPALPAYLWLEIADTSVRNLNLSVDAYRTYDIEIVRDGNTVNHGVFFYKLPSLDNLFNVKLSLAASDVTVRLCN